MKKLLCSIAALALLTAPAAQADTDQFMPQPPLWCPGNVPGTIVSLGYGGYCEGRSYPDGTRWNTYRIGWFWQPLRCVMFDGSFNPPTAPAGGCGGNWAGA